MTTMSTEYYLAQSQTRLTTSKLWLYRQLRLAASLFLPADLFFLPVGSFFFFIKSEIMFRRIEKNANNIGMVDNSDKTQVLCVSAAASYTAETYIRDAQGNRVDCSES